MKKTRNTGDNFKLSQKILKKKGIPFDNALVVTKPYMERRAYATGKIQWPNIDIVVTSPPIQFEEYIKDSIDPEAQINIMVGDLKSDHRISQAWLSNRADYYRSCSYGL